MDAIINREQNNKKNKKEYIKPAIVHELELETKAGTSLPPTTLPIPGFPSDTQP